MEIRNIVRGETVSFAASARLAGKKEADAAQTAGTSPADRVELSNQWVEQMQEQMQEQNAQILSLLTTGKEREEQTACWTASCRMRRPSRTSWTPCLPI